MGSWASGVCREGETSMTEYQVIDLRSETIDHEAIKVSASTPEHAAQEALGLHLVRSGAKKDLVARVYWQPQNQPKSMVRLYKQVEKSRL